jgi:hypothetical protein
MKKLGISAASLSVLALTLMVMGAVSSNKANAIKANASATGSGHFYTLASPTDTTKGDLRTFAFTAIEQKDGDIIGMAELQNRTSDDRVHLDVNCLEINGNVATISGVITKSKDISLIGQTGIFQVMDNGEPGSQYPTYPQSSGPDRISFFSVFPSATNITCHCNCAFDTVPIAHGNIQVRPE